MAGKINYALYNYMKAIKSGVNCIKTAITMVSKSENKKYQKTLIQ